MGKNDPTILWFVLNYIPPTHLRHDRVGPVFEKSNKLFNGALELFAPTFTEMTCHNGLWKRKNIPLFYHYVFVKGNHEQIRQLCGLPNGFSFVLNRADKQQCITLSDKDIQALRLIASRYGNELPCFAIDEINLEKGDLVEVMDGRFAGLVGTYLPKRGYSKGNLMISIDRSLAAIVCDVRAEYVKVLRFAKHSKRIYDQIEAFIPRLFTAMRFFHTSAPLSASVIAPLQVFCRRFDAVRLESPKLEAKLQLLLMTAQQILGQANEFEATRNRYLKYAAQITDPSMQALASLCISILTSDMQELRRGQELLTTRISAADSKMQAALKREFAYYLHKPACTDKALYHPE